MHGVLTIFYIFSKIWANQGGGQHKPPADLVFRQQSSWGSGKGIRTAVTDNEGKVRTTLCQFADEYQQLHDFEIRLLATVVGVTDYEQFLY